jgi:hypothetical protein
MIALTIDEAIAFASDNIANLSYGNVFSLYTRFQSWITGMFSEATGIYKPSANPAQAAPAGPRVVTDWLANHLMAQQLIEGPLAGQGLGSFSYNNNPGWSGVIGTSAVSDAVTRVLSAVKFATINSQITAGQQTATVALFNLTWP